MGRGGDPSAALSTAEAVKGVDLAILRCKTEPAGITSCVTRTASAVGLEGLWGNLR